MRGLLFALVLWSSAAIGSNSAVIPNPDSCRHVLLAGPKIIDDHLVAALKALTPAQRIKDHVPELEEPLRRLRELTASKSLLAKDRFLTYLDHMAQTKRVSYQNFWYATLLSLILRTLKVNRNLAIGGRLSTFLFGGSLFVMDDEITSQRLSGLAGEGDLLLFAFRKYLHDPFRHDDDIYIPLIDTPSGAEQALYQSGQFAESFQPGVYPVAISREDDRELEGFLHVSALGGALHDLVHAGLIRKAFSNSKYRLTGQEVTQIHAAFMRTILSSPRPLELLKQYDTLLHEAPKSIAKVFSVYSDPILWARFGQILHKDGINLERALKTAKLCDGNETVCFATPVTDLATPWPMILSRFKAPSASLAEIGAIVRDSILNGDPYIVAKFQEFQSLRTQINQMLADNPGALVRYDRKTRSLDLISQEQTKALDTMPQETEPVETGDSEE